MLDLIRSKVGTGGVTAKTLVECQSFKFTTMCALDIETSGFRDLPGDSPCFGEHGVMGIALANGLGDALYMVINDKKDYGGIPVADAIKWLNEKLAQVSVLVFHHGKFDLGFLTHRGLAFKCRLVDTWVIESIRCNGIFSSSKLKDLMRERFKIETATEEAKDKFFEEHNTKDYGDLPLELVAPYALDDVRYTLLLVLGQPALTPEEAANHDLYLRCAAHINKAEETGIALNMLALKTKIKEALEVRDLLRAEIKKLLGAAEIDVDNEQEMLKYMHSKNLHSEPWEKYGEVQFTYDFEFLYSCQKVPLVAAYMAFHNACMFLEQFSGTHGKMFTRIWKESDTSAGFHVSMHQSIYSKGGAIQCKAPDFCDRLVLDNTTRALFTPRAGHSFCTVAAWHLPELILAFYCRDAALSTSITGREDPALEMERRTKFSPRVCSILMRQILEGSGNKALFMRLKNAGESMSDNQKHFKMRDAFAAALPGLKIFTDNLNNTLNASGFAKDRLGRVLKVPQDKRWRGHSILIGCSVGSILSVYLDHFCRLADSVGAKLVLAHGSEFVFECPENKTVDFHAAVIELGQREIVQPRPVWKSFTTKTWQGEM